MALSKTRLLDAIINALDADGAYDDALDKAAARADSRVKLGIIIDAIIDEITTHADVSVTVASGIRLVVDPNSGQGATTGTGSGSGGIS